MSERDRRGGRSDDSFGERLFRDVVTDRHLQQEVIREIGKQGQESGRQGDNRNMRRDPRGQGDGRGEHLPEGVLTVIDAKVASHKDLSSAQKEGLRGLERTLLSGDLKGTEKKLQELSRDDREKIVSAANQDLKGCKASLRQEDGMVVLAKGDGAQGEEVVKFTLDPKGRSEGGYFAPAISGRGGTFITDSADRVMKSVGQELRGAIQEQNGPPRAPTTRPDDGEGQDRRPPTNRRPVRR